MMIFPRREHTLHVSHSSEQVYTLLSEETVDTRPSAFGWNIRETFWGQVRAQEFVIHPISKQGTNSFLPKVWGTVQEDSSGCRIHLIMELLPFVRTVLGLWFGGVGFFFLESVLICIFSDFGKGLSFLLVTSAMLLFGCMLTKIAFHFSCKSTIHKLTQILR